MGARLLEALSSVQPGRRLRNFMMDDENGRPAPGHLRAELQTPRRGEEEIRSDESLPVNQNIRPAAWKPEVRRARIGARRDRTSLTVS